MRILRRIRGEGLTNLALASKIGRRLVFPTSSTKQKQAVMANVVDVIVNPVAATRPVVPVPDRKCPHGGRDRGSTPHGA